MPILGFVALTLTGSWAPAPPTILLRLVFQTMTILSSPPEAKKLPVGAKALAVQLGERQA